MVGIVGYGAYVPRYRIKAEEIARQWGADAEAISRGLQLFEKTVPGQDEDTITISVEAARNALRRAQIDPKEIGAVYIGSESHPYAVKPSGTIVVDALGIGPHVHVASYEFACKAGTEAMYVAYSHVKSGEMKYAMGIGADTSQGAPGDALEYSASAGGAAFIMGQQGIVAEILYTLIRRISGAVRDRITRVTADGSREIRRISSISQVRRKRFWRNRRWRRRTFGMPCFTCRTGNFLSKSVNALVLQRSKLKPAGWFRGWGILIPVLLQQA
jgi:3-hydroxy-3-methylglutaryl CoA synthase